MKQLIISVLIALMAFSTFAQQLSTDNRRARKYFKKAHQAYNSRKYDKALEFANRAIQKDNSFTEAYLISSEIFLFLEEDQQARKYLEKLISVDSSKYPVAYRWLGDIYLEENLYENAIRAFKKYQLLAPERNISGKIRKARYRKRMTETPDTITIHHLGSGVNSVNCEFVNAITLDNSELYYTVKPEKTPNERFDKRKRDEDFFFSVKKEGKWVNPRSLGSSVNTLYNEGAMHLSPDGTYLYFTSCRGHEGYGSCDLYYAERLNDSTWAGAQNLGPTINTRHWETQPCFAADGKTLYYVSSRGGGYGKADLWKSVKQPDGSWSYPENLGDSINTRGEEMAPYLHPDGKTLYFSSDGHKGLGGSDLFVSRKRDDSTWSKPVNLGFPINNSGNQINMIVDAAGTTAYISSSDSANFGCYDIYSFRLPKEYRPAKVSYFKGMVYNAVTHSPLQATFELIDLETGEVVVSSHSRKDNGQFMVALPTGRDYGLHVNKQGYMFYSEHFPFNGHVAKPLRKDIPLQPIRVDASEQLNNIFFAFDSDSLVPESHSELKRLLRFMQQNRSVHIEIQGHTDSIGNNSYNKELSERRARRVQEYLVKHNVDSKRITAIGYGETRPVATNDTGEGRARNRRTEIKITDIRNE